MSDPDQPVSASGEQDDPAERLARHLSSRPFDLIDARRLFQRFQVTPRDFQRALTKLDTADPPRDLRTHPA